MFSLIYYAVSLIIKLAPIFEKFIFQTGARVRQFCFLPLVPGVLVARIPVIQATQVQFLGGELRSCFRTTHCCHSENKRTNYIFFLSDTKHPIEEIRNHGSKQRILPNIKDVS